MVKKKDENVGIPVKLIVIKSDGLNVKNTFRKKGEVFEEIEDQEIKNLINIKWISKKL